jgi:protocatechuate 4,5-dioxygenase alpha chain
MPLLITLTRSGDTMNMQPHSDSSAVPPAAAAPTPREATPKTSAAAIPGTYLFDGALALKGYPLNKMCYSFNEAANRAAFLEDEGAYCTRFGLNDEQRDAVRRRDVLALLQAGGNVYYLAKFAGIFGLGVQDIGAQQTGVSVEEFRAKLRAAGA